MSNRIKRPAVFRPDDPNVVVTAFGDDVRPGPSVLPLADADAPALPAVLEPPARRAFPWRKMFWFSAGGLVSLALGLAVTSLIESLFARFAWLGWFGLALAGFAALALLAIAIREILGLMRLAAIEKLRQLAIEVIASDDHSQGRDIVRDLLKLESGAPHLARARVKLEGHLNEIIDGADLLRIAEQDLMAPLDQKARRLVSAAAKRVSIVTAVSPRAAVDMVFVLITALSLTRKLALLYGGRPGTFGLIRLTRHVISHLAITGGMAASDSLIQQVIGHGVAAKLSARLGEGVLNGLLTARLGLAAIEVTRPLPFAALPRPSLSDLAGGLLRKDESAPAGKPAR